MKVATWNVECITPGSWKRGLVIQTALAERELDVLVLTESHPEFRPDDRLSLVAASSDAPDRDGGQRWVCIWARSDWASECLPSPSESERSAAALLYPPGGRPIIIFGTVLPWRSDTRHGALRGGAAFSASLALQSTDLRALRDSYPHARVVFAGDLNQEFDHAGPAGTSVGRSALNGFLADHQLTVVTGGERDPLMRSDRNWMRSIDHIALDAASGEKASAASVWPERCPLPAGWPDHYGVEVSVPDA